MSAQRAELIDFAAITTLAARLFGGGGGQNGCIPRAAALCAAATIAAIAVIIVAAWHPPIAHADGGASARGKPSASAPDDSGATIQTYTHRILRVLTDHDANNWVRYWQARAACDSAAARHAPDAAPLDRVLLTLTAAICAQLDARLGVNPADYSPRGEERGAGLIVNEPGAAVGYTLFSVWDAQKVYLMDPLGRVAHTWHIGDTPLDKTFRHVKLLDNGNLMAMTGNPSAIVEIDPRGNMVWRYVSVGGLHHDFLKMPNGNVLLLVLGIKTREEAIAAGANPEFVHEKGLEYDYLVEVRPAGASEGEVVWEWSVWDHLVQDFDPTKPNYGVASEHPELIDINFLLELRSRPFLDWLHTNAIDYNPELDQIMLSPRHFNELWIIDHSAATAEARGHTGGNSGMGGDLLYRWGNPRAYGHGDADDQRLFWQHNAHWIPPGLPGAGNILLFNNGNEFKGNGRYYSSIDELVLPVDGYRYRRAEGEAYPPDELAWTYAAETPADFYAPVFSGTQRLPNGNTLNADGPAGTIFQATPDGNVVWKYIVPQHYHISLWQDVGAPARLTHGNLDVDDPPRIINNRVHRANWYPPDYAGLQRLDLTPGAYIEDYPDLFDWARAALIDGDFGERLARSHYDIYFDQDELMLIYFKQPCAEEDTRARFFLHIIPSDPRDLPANRREHGFDNMDFNFGDRGKASGGWCVAIAPLSGYAIERIRTGQFTGEGQAWRAEMAR